MNSREKTHLNRAVRVSLNSTCRQHHGVVIARGAKVLAVAVNRERNDPNNCSNPKTEASLHAEVAAIKQLVGVDLTGCVMYSARTNRLGDSMFAKPCKYCQEVIRQSGIRKVIYT